MSYSLSTFLRVEDLGGSKSGIAKGRTYAYVANCLGSVSIHESIRLIIEHAKLSAISQLVRQAMVGNVRRYASSSCCLSVGDSPVDG